MIVRNETTEILQSAKRSLDDSQAEDIVAIDVSSTLPFTDVFVLASADNPRHLKAISHALTAQLREEHQLSPRQVEGEGEATWVLIDYGDVTFHLFLEEARAFYGLDSLWAQNSKISL